MHCIAHEDVRAQHLEAGERAQTAQLLACEGTKPTVRKVSYRLLQLSMVAIWVGLGKGIRSIHCILSFILYYTKFWEDVLSQ